MIDLNQELEDFDAYFFKRHGELPLDPTSEEYANKSYLKHEMFKAWKARAKAQTVPDTPTPSVTLTCAELKEAFDFGAPDGEKDQFQMETEMTIKWLQDGYDGEGYYCWYADLPEEGCIKLGVSESGAEG
ncbi:hypothetical protein [Acinetobacter baumannii]|uniref:hypothetical protein n=1 Tax=Acinetobacter baumannii TaxID=470 RepID=UPI00244900D3|nr:hypothetical protein [Acinetobacter baumannii]MDG9794589.1 hypothetical protein [Acinetobacter baumannii]